MIYTNKKAAIVIGITLCLSSCATTDSNKSQSGAAVGALLGAVVGAALDRNNPARGALLGAGVGAGTGYMVGKGLDRSDQAALKAKIEEAAASSVGEQTVWKSDHSGAVATITPLEAPKQVEETKTIAKNPDVIVEQSSLVFATGERQAAADVKVRLGPGTQYSVKEVLRQGQVVNVLGKTGGGWYVIAEDNRAVGYVSEQYLHESRGSNAFTIQPSPIPIEGKAQTPRRRVEAAPRQAGVTPEVDVRIARVCKPVQVRVRTADGRVTEETVTTCQNSDGSWGA